MKNTLRLAIIGGLVAVAVAQSQAQTTNTNIITFTTNIEQQLNVTLTGVATSSNSGNVVNVRIGNKDLINSLEAATGVSFSPKAKLVVITPQGGAIGGTSNGTVVVVRDTLSRTNVDTDVSTFFSFGTVGNPVTKSKSNSKGQVTGTEWSINTLTFGSTGVDTNGPAATSIFLELQGFTMTTLQSGAFNSSVNGPASINASDAVLQGKISASAGKMKALPVSQ